MVEVMPRTKDDYLAIKLIGRMRAEDYAQFDPFFERTLENKRKVRMLMWLHDFHGWTLAGAWHDLRHGLQHKKHIEKVAIVGEKRSDEMLAWAFEVFTSTNVEFFLVEDLEDAWKWLHGDDSGKFRSRATPG